MTTAQAKEVLNMVEAHGLANEAKELSIKALEFAEFVAMEVLDEETWEYNKYAFPEIACRKLEKIGLVKADGDMWCLAESENKE